MAEEDQPTIDPGEPPQMSAEQVAAIQEAIAQAEQSAQAEEMAAYQAMRAGGLDPRAQEGVSILDEEAQALVDTRVLDGIIRQFREGYANGKIQWKLASLGLMPKDSGVHPEKVKLDVRRQKQALDFLIDIAREMEETEGMAFPAPSDLEIATVSPK